MYSWRVDALENFIKNIEKKSNNKAITMNNLLHAGHLDQYHYLGLDANDDIMQLLQMNSNEVSK